VSFKNGFCELVERETSYAAGFEAHVRCKTTMMSSLGRSRKSHGVSFRAPFADHDAHPRRRYRYERFCYVDADAIVSPQPVAQPPEVHFNDESSFSIFTLLS
jgi:hypothetical protein